MPAVSWVACTGPASGTTPCLDIPVCCWIAFRSPHRSSDDLIRVKSTIGLRAGIIAGFPASPLMQQLRLFDHPTLTWQHARDRLTDVWGLADRDMQAQVTTWRGRERASRSCPSVTLFMLNDGQRLSEPHRYPGTSILLRISRVPRLRRWRGWWSMPPRCRGSDCRQLFTPSSRARSAAG